MKIWDGWITVGSDDTRLPSDILLRGSHCTEVMAYSSLRCMPQSDDLSSLTLSVVQGSRCSETTDRRALMLATVENFTHRPDIRWACDPSAQLRHSQTLVFVPCHNRMLPLALERTRLLELPWVIHSSFPKISASLASVAGRRPMSPETLRSSPDSPARATRLFQGGVIVSSTSSDTVDYGCVHH